ncbi:MAG TPA: NADH-quinone oxidoreductase subunit L [Coriobacteriia bacterium]|nr:NADH-quinone oxidoreductase subunit L [Coriobacteriia bacterium]
MNWVVAIPALPALSFAIFLVASRRLRMKLLWLPIGASFVSLGLSLMAFTRVWPGGSEEAVWHQSFVFGVLGGRPLELSMALDPVAAAILLVVTIVGACVQVYSLGYMHKDDRQGWYFGVLSLFTSAMLLLVLSSNLLLTFMAWEMMGLCSYLLIGFWFENEAPRKASQKAFLTTKVGDLGFLLALFVAFNTIGAFGYEEILESLGNWPAAALAAAGCGLVLAAMGKSAQIPLHVWLPDAMAGPTPASALIHAATMVAAGIYVVARMLPLIALTPWVMHLVLYIGVATALMGGVLACVQHDVKKVLAYSTISQLGFMFMALGAGSAEAALFHLTTHAFFKSLLFLGAGVIIHAAHTQDMRLMGGLGRHMPITAGTFTVGTLALAGVFPFSGFFSKDEIIAVLIHEGDYVVAALALVASALTAFYVARMLFRVFGGPEQTELHEGHTTMLAPMAVLAAITAVGGFASPAFAEFLGGHGVWPELRVALPSLGVAATGLTVGWWFYGRPGVVVNTRIYKERFSRIYGSLEQKLFFDSFYQNIVIRQFFHLADLLAVFDRKVLDGIVNLAVTVWVKSAAGAWRFDDVAIDGTVNGVARADVFATKQLDSFDNGAVDGAVNLFGTSVLRAGAIRKIHTGNVQTYITAFAVAAVVLVLVFVR